MNLENIKRLYLKKNRLSWKISVSVLWKKYKQYYMASRNFWTNKLLLIHWCNEFKQRQIHGWGQVQAQQNGNLMVEELNSRSFISMTGFSMGNGAWNITKCLITVASELKNCDNLALKSSSTVTEWLRYRFKIRRRGRKWYEKRFLENGS